MKLGDPVKHALDWTAFWGAMGYLAQILPTVVGIVSLIWLFMQMYEWIAHKRWRKQDES